MTAEVCVMNSFGVALAADSAMTASGLGEKIWTSCDKLFQLSESEPVAVMIYGSVAFCGLPWETLIKSYRARRSGESLTTVKEHAEAFLQFVESGGDDMFEEDARTLSILGFAFDLFEDLVLDVHRAGLSVSSEESSDEKMSPGGDLLLQLIEQVRRDSDGLDVIAGLEAGAPERVMERHGSEVGEVFDEVFAEWNLLSNVKVHAIELVAHLLCRQSFLDSRTGLVFAGFGSSQYLPELVHCELQGVVEGQIRVSNLQVRDMLNGKGASIFPFAQAEMVRLFMNGIDPEMAAFMQETALEGAKSAFEQIVKLYSADAPALRSPSISDYLEESMKKVFKEWSRASKRYWGPVIDTVKSLPKDELGEMAEALVNLTKFRRRISADAESVGGPIDVLVITKGDGLIWLKRKHYFSPELNHRAIRRQSLRKGV